MFEAFLDSVTGVCCPCAFSVTLERGTALANDEQRIHFKVEEQTQYAVMKILQYFAFYKM